MDLEAHVGSTLDRQENSLTLISLWLSSISDDRIDRLAVPDRSWERDTIFVSVPMTILAKEED